MGGVIRPTANLRQSTILSVLAGVGYFWHCNFFNVDYAMYCKLFLYLEELVHNVHSAAISRHDRQAEVEK